MHHHLACSFAFEFSRIIDLFYIKKIFGITYTPPFFLQCVFFPMSIWVLMLVIESNTFHIKSCIFLAWWTQTTTAVLKFPPRHKHGYHRHVLYCYFPVRIINLHHFTCSFCLYTRILLSEPFFFFSCLRSNLTSLILRITYYGSFT